MYRGSRVSLPVLDAVSTKNIILMKSFKQEEDRYIFPGFSILLSITEGMFA